MKQEWTKEVYQQWLESLQRYSDDKYRMFSEKLIFTKYPMLGIRTPILTQVVKSILMTDIYQFLQQTTYQYYEEVMIEGFVIASFKDPKVQIAYLDTYISKIDNWALCDMVISRMKLVKKYPEIYFEWLQTLLKNNNEFYKRFGYVLLLNYYVEDIYLDKIFELCNAYASSDYYVQMAIAWLLSYCYLQDKDKTLSYLKHNQLDTFTCRKAVQKIRESLRISKEEKVMLKQFLKEMN